MVSNVDNIDLPCYSDEFGSLVAIEANDSIPFDIKRVYYIFGVDEGIRRGFHSHDALEQVLVCVRGSVTILLDDATEEKTVVLDDPTQGLYIGKMVWREMFDFSYDAVLLVMASEHYDTSDYIRDYNEFCLRAQSQERGSNGF